MAYLVILVVVAAAGIFRLWLQQRREHSQMDTIQGFNAALEKISPDTPIPLPKKTVSSRDLRARSRRKAARAAAISRRRAAVSARGVARDERRVAATQRDARVRARKPAQRIPRRVPRPVMATGNVSSMDAPRRAAARRRIEARRRSRAVG
ncbi:MAG: hypothetical protein ACRDJV_06460 [Actinomycetota bacterium]